MTRATSVGKGCRTSDGASLFVPPINWTLSLSRSVRSAATLQNVTEQIFDDGPLVHSFPLFGGFKNFGWQWMCHSRVAWAQELAFDFKMWVFSGSDRMTPSRTNVNISRSNSGLAVLMAFDIARVCTSSTAYRSGKRVQPTQLAQGAQASRPSAMVFGTSCTPSSASFYYICHGRICTARASCDEPAGAAPEAAAAYFL